MRHDVVVIGAGVAGMAAALVLAGCGLRVALVEKAQGTATMVRGFVRRGLQFDTGFHYAGGLGEGQPLDLFLRYLGLDGRLQKEAFGPAGFDTVRIREPEFEFSFPVGREPLRQALHQAFPGQRRAVDGYLAAVAQCAAGMPFMNLEMEGSGPDLSQGPTLREVLDGLGADALLQSVLSAHGFLYGVPATVAPFALHAAVVDLYYLSAGSFQGGGRSLAQAFDAELSRRGVDLYCGQGAAAIELAASWRLRGVRLADERFLPCDACVATMHPRLLPDLLPPGALRPAYRHRLEALEESPSAFLLYGARKAAVPAAKTRPANLFLLSAPEAVADMDGASDTGPLYVTAAPAVSAATTVAGFMVITPLAAGRVATWHDSRLGARPGDYSEFKKNMARSILRRLQDMAPEISDGILWSEGATPLTLRDYGHSPFGSLYGVRHRVGQMNPQTLTRVPGLFLAGQAVAAPGILGAMISAIMATGNIVGRERIRNGLRACR